MMKNKGMINLLLLIAGAACLMFSGINWHIGITAWIAPILLLLFTRNTNRLNFLLFFAVMFLVGALNQTKVNIANLLIVDIFNGLSFGIAFTLVFIIDKALYKKNGPFYYTFTFPVLITLLEFVSSFAFGTWGSLSHAHYEYKPILQLSSLIGIYGVWFLVGWFASVVYWIVENRNNINRVNNAVIIFGSVLFFVLLYGELRINSKVTSEKTVKIAAVLSDTDIHRFAEEESELLQKAAKDHTIEVPDRIFSNSVSIATMIDRTHKAIKQEADIIVWNEISLIVNQTQKAKLIDSLQSVCDQNDVYVLAAFMEECIDENKKPFNNISVFISPDGKTLWEYKKSFLQPTVEALIINSGNYEMPVVETPLGRIGSVICADLDIPNYIKQAAEKSVDILLVPAYDWEGITPIHSQMASVQAIQFGVSIVRVNGKGVSAVYDSMGNKISSLNTFNSDEKVFLSYLPVHSSKTIYSLIGNVFILFSVLFFIFLLLKRLIKTKNSSSDQE